MDVLKPLKYLFYRIYQWQLNTWGKEYVPEFNALFLVSLFVALNLYFVNDVISKVSGVDLFKVIGWGKIQALIVGFGIIGISYFILVKDGQHKKLTKQFSKESKSARVRNLVLCILYVVITFLLFFGWTN